MVSILQFQSFCFKRVLHTFDYHNKNFSKVKIKKKNNDLLLIIMCLAGFSTCQIIMLVSKLPLATKSESGDHATQFTLALWKPHSLSLASYKQITKIINKSSEKQTFTATNSPTKRSTTQKKFCFQCEHLDNFNKKYTHLVFRYRIQNNLPVGVTGHQILIIW